MKQLLTILLTVISFSTFAQDVILGYQKDSVYVDSLAAYKIFYTLYDTSGDVENGNYTVRVNTLDSFTLIASLHNKTLNNYNKIGELEGAKITFLQAGKEYRDKATELAGSDGYREYVMPIIRQAMAGDYILRYDTLFTKVELSDLGQARDTSNTLIFTNAPLSNTWTVIVDRLNNNEPIQTYKIRENIWIGDGSKGRLILRKL